MSSIATFFTDSIIYRTDSPCNRLHQSEEFSDCKLICGPYNFNLHKVILASQSDSTEGDDVCDEPEIVKLMVE